MLSNIYAQMWNRKQMIHVLAKQEIKKEFAGTVLGILWAFINPAIRILVYWFVFSIGARANHNIGDVPFVIWLSVGMISWFFINDAMKNSFKVYRSKRGIIKNTPFPISILPAVQVLFSFYQHILILFVALTLLVMTEVEFSIYWLQIIYYDISAVILLVAFGSFLAPLVAISKDFGRFLDTILIFLFWMTPILWNTENLGEYAWIAKINPFHYIVDGYRGTLLYDQAFWDKPIETLYFWLVVGVVLYLGNYIYSRMKPLFLDVL